MLFGLLVHQTVHNHLRCNDITCSFDFLLNAAKFVVEHTHTHTYFSVNSKKRLVHSCSCKCCIDQSKLLLRSNILHASFAISTETYKNQFDWANYYQIAKYHTFKFFDADPAESLLTSIFLLFKRTK